MSIDKRPNHLPENDFTPDFAGWRAGSSTACSRGAEKPLNSRIEKVDSPCGVLFLEERANFL